MNHEVQVYNDNQTEEYASVCNFLANEIDKGLPESENKIWHAHPVWFLDGNPIVGYSIQKPGVRLMFWSGKDFETEGLTIQGEKFKDASVFYTKISEIDVEKLQSWLAESFNIQWDYKNLVKRKGQLERLK